MARKGVVQGSESNWMQSEVILPTACRPVKIEQGELRVVNVTQKDERVSTR